MEQNQKITVRSLMPRGYTSLLVKKTKRSQPYVTKVVRDEIISSPIWPDVMKLAEENKAKLQEESQRLQALKATAA